MKAKSLVVSTVTVAAIAVIVSYLATRPGKSKVPSSPAAESSDSRTDLTPQRINASGSDQAMDISGHPKPAGHEAAMAPPTDINPEQLKKAEQMLSMMEAARPFIESNPDMGQGEMILRNSEALARKLELRLNMGTEQATAFSDILTAHAQENVHRMDAAMQDANRKLSEFLNMDREMAVTLLALDMLRGEGRTLTPEQEAYYQAYSEQYGPGFGQSPGPSANSYERWYDNAEVLAALEAQLDPVQQAELKTYVEEQRLREREQQIYQRSNRLANDLGLNEADRQALYDYLNENPDATDGDIQELLTPELKELMDE